MRILAANRGRVWPSAPSRLNCVVESEPGSKSRKEYLSFREFPKPAAAGAQAK
jgi:hypothetical protein